MFADVAYPAVRRLSSADPFADFSTTCPSVRAALRSGSGMTGPAARIVIACVLAMAALACGKKGNPLPPLRPVPARIADLTVLRTLGQVELRFTVPAANLDGTAPAAIDRVDIFARRAVPGQPPPGAAALAADPRNLLESLPIGRPQPADGTTPATVTSALVPRPGDVAVFVDRVEPDEQAGTTAIYYVAVPVAGTGRGRSGPPTAVALVPLGPLPPAPANLAVSHDETTLRVTWTPEAADQAFRVFRAGAASGRQELLTPTPVAGGEFTLPVIFGREVCVSAGAVQATGAVTVEGPRAGPVCVTPADRYPPPVPAGLRVVQEGTVVTLIWDAVEAADLAGYVVLRSVGADPAMMPLFQGPVTETTYRDTTAVPGQSYSYAVYSVDHSPAANVSGLSVRENITVR